MRRFQVRRRLAAIIALLVLALAVAPVGAAAKHKPRAGINARVVGFFAMRARVTTAVRVRGEHRGQILQRTWLVAPSGCQRSVCHTLTVERERGDQIVQRLTMHRTGPGRYAGRGRFYVALRCLGRVYPHGSRVPFQMTLTVTRATRVQGISFARAITASYDNPRRTDVTPCPLGPSHDAARYTGRAQSAEPTPPSVSFTTTVNAVTGTGGFIASVTPGAGGAPVLGVDWNFGDPASGQADTASGLEAIHRFSAAGRYEVTALVTDANGLTGSVTNEVSVSRLFGTGPRPARASTALRHASRSVSSTAASSPTSRATGNPPG